MSRADRQFLADLAKYSVKRREEEKAELRQLKKLRPTAPIKYIDSNIEKFLGTSKTTSRLPLTHRLLAVNFLAYHFKQEQINDAIVASLQTLLAEHFKLGFKRGRRSN